MFTAKEKQIIRQHYPHLILRFTNTGMVMASQGKGRPYGVLYTAVQARSHIEAFNTVEKQLEA